MKVILADNCGFCPGVENAVTLAERVLAEKKDVYSLGAVIHNTDVVERLALKGLKTVEGVDEVPGGTVLIRSHGASAEQMDMIRKRGLDIADATCVLVKRVQRLAARLCEQGYKVVIVGDRDHPEVRAVVGTCGDVVVVADRQDLESLPRAGKLGVLCQTTESPEHFNRLLEALIGRGFGELRIINTLCREAIKRQQSAIRLCQQVDVMFVLGGKSSANTRKLAEMCGKYNHRTFHLQNFGDFDRSMTLGCTVAGVTAGASTPRYVISEFVERLETVHDQ